MSDTIFIPVGYAEAADRIAELVNRGLIRIQDHWRSKEACLTYIKSLPNSGEAGGLITSTIEYMATPVVIRVAGDVARAAPFPPASPLCGSGKPFTNAEGAPRVRASAQTDDRSPNRGACSLGTEHKEAPHAA